MMHRFVPIALALTLIACGESADAPSSSAAPPAAEQPDASAALPAASTPAALPRTPAPAGASVYIVSPADGATVQSPFRVVFGLKGFGVVPAGIARPDAGHHHLLIDVEVPAADAPIPADDGHRHFGLGQTETELSLPAGEHTLQLLLGDHLHIPHDPPLLSETITVQVAE